MNVAPTTVVVADFTRRSGPGRHPLARSQAASRVDITNVQEGLTAPRGTPNDGWDTLTKGVALE
jgi:hypothetical protein